jgi:hypothetical protein
MANISRTLQRIKEDLQPFISDQDILDACRDVGHAWRKRLLDPVVTVHLFILQILHANTAMHHLRHLANAPVKPAAYCKARMRLPLAVLQRLLARTAEAARREPTCRSNDRRVYLVDGSSTICPDVAGLQKAFGQPSGCKPGCGFPVPKLLGVFDAWSGMVQELLVLPLYTQDLAGVWRLHRHLQAGDVLAGDRGFCSFGHLAILAQEGVHGLFRLHQRAIVSFRPHRRHGGRGQPTSGFVRRLGRYDQLVDWHKPATVPRWMSREQYEKLPATLRVREVRYHLARNGQRTRCVTIATTLTDPIRDPRETILELYRIRWNVETHFAELKTTLKMRRIKCKTVEGIRKELAVYCLVYNLVHGVMVEAAVRQHVDPRRISFLDTVRWLRTADAGEPLPALLVNPLRLNRHEPRVLKDLQDTYRKMVLPRRVLRQQIHLWGGRPK